MKKNKLLIIASIVLLSACKKETTVEPEEEVNCFCGDVELQYIRYSTATGDPIGYTYFSRNNCTNAVYRFETITEYTEKEYCLNYQW